MDVFVDGWTQSWTADDMVARWAAPGGMLAQHIRVIALMPGFGHDGNAQIDAIIAGIDPNLKVSNFEVDPGDKTHKRFIVDYAVEHAPVNGVTIQIMASPDGVQHGPVLKSVTYGQMNPGTYQWIFEDLVPPSGDHYLIAVIDPADQIEEWNEGDNQILFKGGTFYSPTTEWVYTQDSDHNYADLRSSVNLLLQQFQDGFKISDYPLHIEFFATVGLENVQGLTLYTHDGDDSFLVDPQNLPMAVPLVWYAGAGNETFNGTAFADVFDGGAGNDTAYGLAGADVLFGGEGDDLIYGGLGNDILEGGNGYDRLYGEDGATTVRVGPESTDSIYDDLYAEWGTGDSTAIDWQGGRSGIKAILSDRTLSVLGSGSGHMDFVQDAGGWSMKRNGTGTLDLFALYASQAVPLTLESGTTRVMANLKTSGYPLQTITAGGGSLLEVHTTQNLNELHVVSSSGLVMMDHGSNALVVNLLEVQTATGSYIDVRNNDCAEWRAEGICEVAVYRGAQWARRQLHQPLGRPRHPQQLGARAEPDPGL
jgi:hypothetical protein